MKFEKKKRKSDFIRMLGLVDTKSNQMIFHKKNLKMKEFDEILETLKRKIR